MAMGEFETKLQFVAIAGIEGLAIRSLLDRHQYYDPHGTAERLGICSASWPLFGMVWPSGVQLAAQLARRPVCDRERILEIGCGLGLASLVAHRRGARITASDRHPLARRFLDANASLNGLAPLKYRHGQWGVTHRPCTEDMGAKLLSARYDLIVGSDLLYDRDAPQALAFFIDDHAQFDSEVWVVDPDRGHRPAFTRHMAAYGFELVSEARLGRRPAGSGRHGYKGRMLVYRRGTAQ